ncbi:MAG: S41 family peptidase [Bacteroidales bacterium]|nr:S41 family peptidase [Bacteroidales bacterium]
MKNTSIRILLVLLMLPLCSCEKLWMGNEIENSATETFEYLWRQVDERYSLFDVKNVDWQAVHDNLAPRVYDGMSSDSLFAVLSEMLNTLDDGHVNLWSDNDVFGSEAIFLQRYGNGNFDLNTVSINYLTPHHHTTGGFAYNAIADGQVLYIRYSSFTNSASTSSLEYILKKYADVKGVVFDIRQNGGGVIQNEWNIMALLPCRGQMLYSTQLKAGPAHNDFGEPVAVFAPENKDHTVYTKPFVVLTDRGCYSAASSFALCVKTYDNVIVMGDTTAGGLAIPAGGALPNGWYYRFGVSRTLATDGVNYENGVPPDQVVTLLPEALATGHDNIIDSACTLILNQ